MSWLLLQHASSKVLLKQGTDQGGLKSENKNDISKTLAAEAAVEP
jgi:hypothetical protein